MANDTTKKVTIKFDLDTSGMEAGGKKAEAVLTSQLNLSKEIRRVSEAETTSIRQRIPIFTQTNIALDRLYSSINRINAAKNLNETLALNAAISSVNKYNKTLEESAKALERIRTLGSSAAESGKKFTGQTFVSPTSGLSVNTVTKTQLEEQRKQHLDTQNAIVRQQDIANKQRLASYNSMFSEIEAKEKALSDKQKELQRIRTLGISTPADNRGFTSGASGTVAQNRARQAEELARQESDILKRNLQGREAALKSSIDRQLAIERFGIKSIEVARIEAAERTRKLQQELSNYILRQQERVASGSISAAGATSRINRAQEQFREGILRANTSLNEQEKAVQKTTRQHDALLIRVGKLIISYNILRSVWNRFTQALGSIPQVGIQLEATQAILASTIGSLSDVPTAMAALSAEAKRTGIEIQVVRESFRNFQASTSLAGETLDTTWKIFTDLNTVITALHLSTFQAQGVFNALAQIFNKGKLQSEELVKQLGNLLPGAFAAFAQATGRSTRQLSEDMKQGLVVPHENIVLFTAFLKDRFGAAFAAASQGVNANIGRMKSSFTELGEAIYTTSSGPFNTIIKAITSFNNYIIDGINGNNNLINSVINVANVIGGILVASLVSAISKTTLLKSAFGFLISPHAIIAGITAISFKLLELGQQQKNTFETSRKIFEEFESKSILQDKQLTIEVRAEQDTNVKLITQQLKEQEELTNKIAERRAQEGSIFLTDQGKQEIGSALTESINLEIKLKEIREKAIDAAKLAIQKADKEEAERAKNIFGTDGITKTTKELSKEYLAQLKNIEGASKNFVKEQQRILKQLDFSYKQSEVSIKDFFQRKKELELGSLEDQLLSTDEALALAKLNKDLSRIEQFEAKKQDLLRQTQDVQDELDRERILAQKEYADVVRTTNEEYLTYLGRIEEATRSSVEADFAPRLKKARIEENKVLEEQLLILQKAAINKGKVEDIDRKRKLVTDELVAREQRLNNEIQSGFLDQFTGAQQLIEIRNEKLKQYDDEITKLLQILSLQNDNIDIQERLKQLQSERAGVAQQGGGALPQRFSGDFGFISDFKDQQAKLEQSRQIDTDRLTETAIPFRGEQVNQTYSDMLDQRLELDTRYSAQSLANYSGLYSNIFGLGSDTFQGLTDAAVKMYGAQSKQAQRAFAFYKATKIAEVTIATAQAVMNAIATAGNPYVGYALAAVATVMGAAQVAQIAAQQPPAAHGGLTNVPKEQTFLLDKGERVLSPRQNTDLTKFINNNTINNTTQNKSQNNIRIINSVDPGVMQEYLGSAEGEEVIMNVVRRNQEA